MVTIAKIRRAKWITMSIILVATYKGKTWVVKDVDGEGDWESVALEHISNKKNKFSLDRSKALLMAHNIQRKQPSEKGVWEILLKSKNKKT